MEWKGICNLTGNNIQIIRLFPYDYHKTRRMRSLSATLCRAPPPLFLEIFNKNTFECIKSGTLPLE